MSGWVWIIACMSACILINILFGITNKKGKSFWVINEGTGNMICAHCKEKAIDDGSGHWYVFDYCPHCGFEMNTDKPKYYTPKEKHKK